MFVTFIISRGFGYLSIYSCLHLGSCIQEFFPLKKNTINHIYFPNCNCDLQTKLPSLFCSHNTINMTNWRRKKLHLNIDRPPKGHKHLKIIYIPWLAFSSTLQIVGQTLITIQEKSWFSKWHKVHLKMCPHAQTNKNTAATSTKSFHRRKREEARKLSYGGGSKHFERYFWKSQKVVSKEGTF